MVLACLVRLVDAFKDFSVVSNKLMQEYGLPLSTVQLMQRARLFKDPTVSAFERLIEQRDARLSL